MKASAPVSEYGCGMRAVFSALRRSLMSAVIEHAFGERGYDVLVSGARVSNPASRRVLQKCGFEWTGVGLYRIRALASLAPVDRFRLDRGLWA